MNAAGAKAAANCPNMAGNATDAVFRRPFDDTGSPAEKNGGLATSTEVDSSFDDISGAQPSRVVTCDGMEVDNAATVVGGAVASNANCSFLSVAVGSGEAGSGASSAAMPSTPTAALVEVMQAADVSDVEHGSAIPFVCTYTAEHWDSILGIYQSTGCMFCTCVYLLCWSRSGHSLLG